MGRRNVRVTNDASNLTPNVRKAHLKATIGAVVLKPFTDLDKRTTHVMYTTDGDDARLTLDGATDPVGGSIGLLIPEGQSATLSQEQAVLARFIREAGTSVNLNAQEMSE